VFFKDGVTDMIIKTDNNGFLTLVKEPNKLTAEVIRNSFVAIVAKRRKYTNKSKIKSQKTFSEGETTN
jgi:hypothetical protein